MQQCEQTAVVVTKTDLFAHWQRICDLDRGHVGAAGLEVPLLAVSSFLRMRAAADGDEALNARSGFPELLAGSPAPSLPPPTCEPLIWRAASCAS